MDSTRKTDLTDRLKDLQQQDDDLLVQQQDLLIRQQEVTNQRIAYTTQLEALRKVQALVTDLEAQREKATREDRAYGNMA